ncbi:acyl carrier protein-like protein [Papiliotrema laurentii]|uniref:Acyl carrier protein n=1 Tax=Papiliotrema laurentii TaxID=5418 RepID=A0AAD9FT80_PAPLA|nr:acyl carrier protein-like protein [Papiliotrema laurentii]
MTGATRGAGGTVTNHLERVSPPQPTYPLIPPLNTIRIMFTAALRTASRSVAPRAGFRMAAASPAASLRPILLARGYASAGLSRDDITARVLDVLKTFEKVDGGKLSPTASFTNDLGLDSLDAVEVVMAIEEEFAVEIPDAEADEITSVGQAIDYIAKTPDAQ